MSRRTRIGAAGATFTLLLTAACGGGSESGDGGGGGGGGADLPECPVDALDGVTEPVEITIWHTQQAKPLTTLEELVAEYNESQDRVEVTLEAQGSSYQELQRKFESSIASEGLPQGLVFDDTATQTMVDSGVVMPAQSCIDAEDYDTSGLLPVAVDYYTIDGALWPASAGLGNALLFYNRSHFAAAGLDPDDPPTTLAEVREAAEAIKDAGVIDTPPVVHELAAWKTEFWLTGAGAPMVDNDNGRGDGETAAAAFEDNADATELFTWFHDMQADGLLQGIPRAEGSIDHFLAMASGSASMMVESSSAATSVEAFLGGELDTSDLGSGEIDEVDPNSLDIGAGVFPGLHEGDTTQMGGAAWYMTNTGSPEQIAATWDFMKFMNEPESQAAMLIGGSYLPYTTAANDLPEVVDFYAASSSGRWLEIANAQVEAIDPAFPGPLIGPYYDFREELEKAQDDLMVGGASVDEALAQAQETITAALERYNEETF